MLMALPSDVWSQPAPRVSLLVTSPGAEIYSLEGHAALRLDYTMSGGPDVAVDWGLFDFNSPNFVYRFVAGETDYLAGARPADYFIGQFVSEGRAVREYPIDMTDSQAIALADMVSQNLLPENRVYRYNYVLDNCATRPLQLIEKALGDTLRLGIVPELGHHPTFRQAMRHYHTNYPWYQFGIDLALGTGIDREVKPRAMAFAPTALAEMLTRGGYSSSEIVPPGNGGPEGPTPWCIHPLTVCWLFFAICMAISMRDIRRRALSRWFDTFLFAIFGIAGCVVFFLIFISVHEATSPNWIGLWLNPFCFSVPILIWLKKTKKMLITYQIANFGALIALLIIWVMGAQSLNAAFLPLILSDMMRSATYLKLNRW